jgi:2,3-diketo-5-methylthiopentyl-1-phosphate enolase
MTIEVDYCFPAGVDPHKQARVIAVGQTVGTWDARFAHREAALRSHLAEVVSVQTETQTGHSIATIRFPEANVENDISSLLTMIFGKYSMAGAAKIVAVRLPETYGHSPKVGKLIHI